MIEMNEDIQWERERSQISYQLEEALSKIKAKFSYARVEGLLEMIDILKVESDSKQNLLLSVLNELSIIENIVRYASLPPSLTP